MQSEHQAPIFCKLYSSNLLNTFYHCISIVETLFTVPMAHNSIVSALASALAILILARSLKNHMEFNS